MRCFDRWLVQHWGCAKGAKSARTTHSVLTLECDAQIVDRIDLCGGEIALYQSAQDILHGVPSRSIVDFVQTAPEPRDRFSGGVALGDKPAAQHCHFLCLLFGAAQARAQQHIDPVALFDGWQRVQFDEGLRDGADCDPWVIDPFDGMRICLTAKGKAAWGVYGRRGEVLCRMDRFARIGADIPPTAARTAMRMGIGVVLSFWLFLEN